MSEQHAERGFTLTEMLVVITVVALTLTLSLPYSQTSGSALRLDAAADSVASTLRATRSLAISNNAPQTLTIDLDTRTLARDKDKTLYTLPSSIQLSLTTADDLVAEHQGGIAFFANGSSSGGTLTLSDGKLSRRVAINWLTGAIVTSAAVAP